MIETSDRELRLSKKRLVGIIFIVLGVTPLIINGVNYFIILPINLFNALELFYVTLGMVFAAVALVGVFLTLYADRPYDLLLALIGTTGALAIFTPYAHYMIQNSSGLYPIPLDRIVFSMMGLILLTFGVIGALLYTLDYYRGKKTEQRPAKKRRLLGGILMFLIIGPSIQLGYYVVILLLIHFSMELIFIFLFGLLFLLFSALATAGGFLDLYFDRPSGLVFGLVGSLGLLVTYMGLHIYEFSISPSFMAPYSIASLLWSLLVAGAGVAGALLLKDN